jgi:ABC-2 type transport system permease protein
LARRLVWLKARLLWNGLRADRQRRIGLPLIVAFLAWAGVRAATGYLDALAGLPPAAAAEASGWAALLFFAVWVALPVVIFPLDENLDPARFALMPIGGPRLALGLGLSALVAPSVVVPVIVVAANAVAWRAVLPVTVVASLLMIALLVTSGQLFTATLSAILRTRRGRDLSVVLVGVIGLTGFLSQQRVRDVVADGGIGSAVADHPILADAWYLPPVAIQRIVTEAAAGRAGMSVVFAAVSIGWLLLLGMLWIRVLRRLLTTPEQASGPQRSRRNAGLSGRLGWGSVLVVARKELRFYLRDPRQRLVWTGAVIFIGLALASVLAGTLTVGAVRAQEWLPLLAPILVLFVGLPIALNLFGWERNAASFLFVLPIGARRLLVGKNLAAATALALESSAMAVVLAAVSGAWRVLPLVPALSICAIACQLAVGNLVSVLAPLRLPREGTDVFAQATEQGCLAIGAQLVSFFVIGSLLILPASVAALAVSFGEVVADWVAVAFSLGWGALFYALSLWLAGRLLSRRLPEVAQSVQVV